MKNTQKMLLAILALVFVAVIVLVIVVKSDNNESTANENQPSYSIPSDEMSSEENNTNNLSQQNHNHEHAPSTTVSSNKPDTDKNNSSVASNQNSSDSQSSETYDLSNAEVLQTQRSSFGEIRLLSAKSNGMNVYLLESTIENKKFYYEFPGSYIIENIYYANVDGHYGDEVIVRANIGIKGLYNNVVLKITKNGIESLLSKNQAVELMSGFTSTLKKDFNVEISNIYTNKKETVNVKGINNEDYTQYYWDKDGNITESDARDNVWFEESYYTFEPRDVDEDGIYEIVCSQYASLGSLDSIIGYAQTTLRFSKETKAFEITDSKFYPKSK